MNRLRLASLVRRWALVTGLAVCCAGTGCGSGGQTVTVVPDLDLVVATFAGNFSSGPGMGAASTEPIPRIILPAVREPGDDRSAPVIERKYVSPYGRSTDGSRVTKTP